MGIAASLMLMFLSVFDYLYQRYDHEKNIKMSKQDVKDEYKKMEGDPLIKSRIKDTQRQMAQQRMMSEVPTADVIITNPTHFSIALKYDEENLKHHSSLPKVQIMSPLKSGDCRSKWCDAN